MFDWERAKTRQEIASTTTLTISPRSTLLFVLCFMPRSSNRAEQLSGRLIFDQTVKASIKIVSLTEEHIRRLSKTVGWTSANQALTVDDVPSREIPIRATVASSALSLFQSHIHFGAIRHAWERRHATLSILNKSAVALLYRVLDKGCVHVAKGHAVNLYFFANIHIAEGMKTK